jgi:hypothetical protein
MLETVYESNDKSNNIYERYKELSNEIRNYDELIDNNVQFDELGFDPYEARILARDEMKKISNYLDSKGED